VAILLGMFFVVDYRNYLRAPRAVRKKLAEPRDQWRISGLPNLFFMSVILAAVFIKEPPFLREALMLGAAAGSYVTTRQSVHAANEFSFHPIQEVAILFAGIFATMMPALDWLQANASKIGEPSLPLYYWGSGLLSSILDNAPTYMAFFKAIFGAMVDQGLCEQIQQLIQTGAAPIGPQTGPIGQTFDALRRYYGAALLNKSVTRDEIEMAFLLGNAALSKYILAISVGAVFGGANTYIGNGPNFMVKAIADRNKIHTPTFLGYIFRFALPFMLPMLVFIWWLFFRG